MDKLKHFFACFALTLLFGIDTAILCAILREYDSYCYGKFDLKDSVLDLVADFLGIGLALLVGGLYGK